MRQKDRARCMYSVKCMFVSIINVVGKIYDINELKYFDRTERHDF